MENNLQPALPKLSPDYLPKKVVYRDNLGVMVVITNGIMTENNPRPIGHKPEYISLAFDDIPYDVLVIHEGKIIENLLSSKLQTAKYIGNLGG